MIHRTHSVERGPHTLKQLPKQQALPQPMLKEHEVHSLYQMSRDSSWTLGEKVPQKNAGSSDTVSVRRAPSAKSVRRAPSTQGLLRVLERSKFITNPSESGTLDELERLFEANRGCATSSHV